MGSGLEADLKVWSDPTRFDRLEGGFGRTPGLKIGRMPDLTDHEVRSDHAT